MKILAFTAGAGPMYCGSCIRDNALAAEIKNQGHDLTLVPLYTPTLTDEPNVSEDKVFCGGVSVISNSTRLCSAKHPGWSTGYGIRRGRSGWLRGGQLQ